MTKGSKRWLGASVATMALLAATAVAAQTRQFNVPSEEAAKSIPEFARQAGVQITAPVSELRGRRTPAITGQQDVRSALAKLLAGTGLEVASDNGATIILRRAATPTRISADGGTEQPASVLDEVVVTAQKRSESAQNVPITLTAFGARDLEKRNIEQVSDLSRFTPGFNAAQFSYGKPIFAIRGAENTFSAAGATKPVGVFIDEVYIPRFSASNITLSDVQSVSVLKGPQGTLFGRNVTAGAILVQTREPSLQGVEANARAGVGNYGLREFSGYVSTPLSDETAVSLSVNREQRDGFGKDLLTGRDEDDADTWAARGKFLFKPKDALKLQLSADYGRDKNGGRALSALTGSDTDRRTSQLGVVQTFERDMAGGSVRIDYGDGPIKLTSITGYRYSDTFEIFSRSGLSYLSLASGFQEIGEERERDSAFSQEGRLTYDGEALSLIAGVFYFNEDSERGFRKYRLNARTGAITMDNFYDQDVRTTSAAPFADATWHVTDRFDLTGGVRYTYEDKDAREVLTSKTAPATSFTGIASQSWSEVTYRGVATWRPTRDVTLYGSYATGFTAGGFNTEADVIGAFRAYFNPERSASFELGLKSRFAEGRGRFNVAAFSTKYKDKQEFVFNNLTFVGNIINAAQASARGVEADVAYSPIRALTFSGTFAYLHGEYDQFVIPGAAAATGNPLGNSPRYTYSLSADLDQPMAWGRLLASASYSHKDSYRPSATLPQAIPATGLLNAQIGVGALDERWRLMLWGRNLTNEQYPLIISNYSVNAEWLAPPRTFGLRLSYRYQ